MSAQAEALPAAGTGRPRSPAADRALIDATLAILEEDGYARLSMAGIAKRAGVSATTLYRRWSSKEDVVSAAMASLHSGTFDADTGSLVGDLAALLGRFTEALRSEPGRVLRGVVGEMVKSPELAALVQDRLGSASRGPVTAMLERAVARGEIPPVDLGVARNVVIGPLFHRFMMDGESPSPHVVAVLVPMILAALRAGTPA